MIRYAIVLLLATTRHSSFVSSEAKTTNEVTNFGEILASIRTDAWLDLNITDEEKNVSTCIKDVATVWESAAAGNKWALHMLDAESKLQSGVLLGNLRNLGMYDQCVEIALQHNPTNIQSQYCMVSLSIPPRLFGDASSLLLTNKVSGLGESAGSALSFTSAMCLPTSCSENDISVIVSEIIKQKTELETSEIEVAQVICSRPRDGRFSTGEILVGAFFAMAVSFLLSCTVCDFLIRRKAGSSSSLSMKNLAKLSLYTNAVSTLSTDMIPDSIAALDGLRVLSMIHIIVFHRILNTPISPIINPQRLFEWQHAWYATFSSMAPFTVDTFFIISSFLFIHNLLKSMHSGKKFNILESCISRYLRLTPAAFAMILLSVFYVHRLGSGPVWGFTEDYIVGYCTESWWINLLHLQNTINANHMCLPHLWHLAVEMQLFFVTQIILYALFRWPKYRKTIFSSVIVGSLVVPPILFAINGYTSAFFKMTPEMSITKLRDNLINGYMSTIPRSSAYLTGAVLAYITVNQKIQVTRFQAKVYWIVACSFMLTCSLATRYLYLESYKYDAIFEVAYAALARPAWSFAIAWIIYACMHGHGGPLANFLSAPVFLPLHRISYCTYLVHFILQTSMATGIQVPTFHSNFATLHQSCGDLLVSSTLGFFLSLFVETPVRILEKTLRNSSLSQALLDQKSSKIISAKSTHRKSQKME